MSGPKIRPKTINPATVLPKGRGGSIVIPLAPNVPGAGVQLRPPAIVQTKPTLQPVQVKQDASTLTSITRFKQNLSNSFLSLGGVKVISGSHKITPKPPMGNSIFPLQFSGVSNSKPLILAVTVTSGSNRVVSIASAPRISPMISTCHQPIITTATITTHAAVSSFLIC